MKTWILWALVAVVIGLVVFRTKSFADTLMPSPSPMAPAPAPGTGGPEPGQQYYFVATADTPCPPGYFKPNASKKPKICQLNNS